MNLDATLAGLLVGALVSFERWHTTHRHAWLLAGMACEVGVVVFGCTVMWANFHA